MTVKHDKEKKITYSVNQKYELTSRQCQLLNNFKLALIIVLLEVRKDVKLTTLGGRQFQATATRPLISLFTHAGAEPALICDNYIRITTYTSVFRTFQAKINR